LLKDIPARDYYVQALINVYTQVQLFSKTQRIHFDPAGTETVTLSTDQAIPPVDVPPDTQWVKRIKLQSKLLTKFWGYPMYIGATILLPKG
jgi:hypothetical protein